MLEDVEEVTRRKGKAFRQRIDLHFVQKLTDISDRLNAQSRR